MKNNPRFYEFMVSANSDYNLKEISFSYNTKQVVAGDEIGFKYLDFKVPENLVCCHSYKLIQTMVLLNKDDKRVYSSNSELS